ncbi:hypothetical protein KIN20_009451 [Parelaphostrongylus tenuis]|uniref:Uncharacterized protein n=1 Tax=Parelaphostrongylus tenuis TaxID=148309 RepID=A0AAD5M6E2_PARTN|nr:hypothetical protein KIN20_009451 [Parelaphostrongylus tenuis]
MSLIANNKILSWLTLRDARLLQNGNGSSWASTIVISVTRATEFNSVTKKKEDFGRKKSLRERVIDLNEAKDTRQRRQLQ